ncbi:protein RIC-3 isoform X3 [Pogona vitticeps]|uniref:Protein RIC-3 isoform X3 n=1 Tax=Pogona vitticeps TaxID=103695 RepID=A0ABM5F8W4_9SAUR
MRGGGNICLHGPVLPRPRPGAGLWTGAWGTLIQSTQKWFTVTFLLAHSGTVQLVQGYTGWIYSWKTQWRIGLWLCNQILNSLSRAQNGTTDQEKRLLQQLREITRVMKEGKLIDGISPEQEAEEAPYMQDWEGYPEETYPVYDNSDCYKRRQGTILVDYPDPSQPSAEELAERMEFVDDEDYLCSETLLSALALVNDGPAARSEKDQHATFSDQSGNGHHFEKCYCCHYEEDDPAVIAENAGFFSDSCSETEDTTKGELSVESDHENAAPRDQSDEEIGLLRKRNTKGMELLGQ